MKDKLAPYKYPRDDRVHRRAAEDGDRQDPALPPARARAPARRDGAAFVDVAASSGRTVIHRACVRSRPRAPAAPLVVFLHEGLGSLAMWKDYPQRAVRCRRLARPRVLAPGLRPLDAARARRALAGRLHARAGARGPAALLARRRRRRGRGATAVALRPQRRRLDRAHLRGDVPGRGRPAWSPSRRTSWSRTLSIAEHRRRARRLRDDGPAGAPRALPRRPRLRVLGLERRLARPGVPRLVDRGYASRRCDARCSRCRARTTSTARSRRSTASRSAAPRPEVVVLRGLRPFAAPRPPGRADARRHRFHRAPRGDAGSPRRSAMN